MDVGQTWHLSDASLTDKLQTFKETPRALSAAATALVCASDNQSGNHWEVSLTRTLKKNKKSNSRTLANTTLLLISTAD